MLKNVWIIFVGAALLLLSELALAQAATVSSLTGTARATPGAGAPRSLKQGDAVNQGDAVATGPNSSLVLTFDDGQVVALTANSRLVVSAYSYNKAQPASSNILLNLAQGGMRAITGLIGKARPTAVAYRAGNATIGIRGTDLELAVADDDDLYVIVDAGEAEVETEVDEEAVAWMPLSGHMVGMMLPAEMPRELLHLAKKRVKKSVKAGNGFIRIKGISSSMTAAEVRKLAKRAAKLAVSSDQLDRADMKEFVNQVIKAIQARQDALRSGDTDSRNIRVDTPGVSGQGSGSGGGGNLPACSSISPVSSRNPGVNCN